MNFIKCKENPELVNLDNVSYVYPAKSPDTTTRPHKIYFVHTAMNRDDVMETVWNFDDEEAFNRVFSAVSAEEV